MSHAWVAGAAMTRFGKETPDLPGLAERAVGDALADAGIGPEEVQQVFFGNAAAGLLHGQEMIRGQVLLRDTGLLGTPIVNVENACASSSTAFQLAVAAVQAEQADVAVAVGAEQLAIPSRERTFAALAGAADTVRLPALRAIVEAHALGVRDPAEIPLAASPLMAHYAAKAETYLERHGGTAEDLALVVVNSRRKGALNPNAQFITPVTVEEVLAGRMIAEPLRLAMCAPISNGAAALVVMSDAAAGRYGRSGVRVRGMSMVSGDPASSVSPARAAADVLFGRTGVEPAEVDLVEVHDAAASAQLILLEELRLAEPGEALDLLRTGATDLNGKLPVNPSGGLLSRGHPIGATGSAQLVELTDQLRGRAGGRQVTRARLGLAENGGGVLDGDEAVVALTLLERTGP
jgi:acetyl-CoA acetyltransferase